MTSWSCLRRSLAPFALGALAAALAACGPPEVVPAISAPDADRLLIQLAVVRVVGHQLEHDEVRLALACLERSGVDDLPTPPRREPVAAPEAFLQALGYDVTTTTPEPDPPDYWGALEARSDEQALAFEEPLLGGDDWHEAEIAGNVLGAGAQGCMAEARAGLYGDLDGFLLVTFLPQIALAGIEPSTVDSPSERRALARAWAAEHADAIVRAHRLASTACKREGEAGCRVPAAPSLSPTSTNR